MLFLNSRIISDWLVHVNPLLEIKVEDSPIVLAPAIVTKCLVAQSFTLSVD